MAKTVIERRWVTSECELRTSSGGKPILEGYASVFNSRSGNLGGFTEEVAPTAFNKTLRDGADVRALLNHDANYVLGRSKSGTLRMATDTTGLHYEVDLGEQSYARDLAITLERGDISQSSFAFRTIQDDWEEDHDTGAVVRTLLEVALVDVSPVTYPAYDAATSGMGSRALESLAERRGLAPGAITPDNLLEALRGIGEAPEGAAESGGSDLVVPEPVVVTTRRLPRVIPVDPATALAYLSSR